MARAKIKIDEKEFEFGDSPATFGRTADNLVPFPDNTNISRNHARIDYRDGAFWLSDLGSSNGTTVNGQRFDLRQTSTRPRESMAQVHSTGRTTRPTAAA